MAHPRWRRRNLLVNRKLQVRFIALLFLQMGLILATLGFLVQSHVSRTSELALGIPFVDARSRAALQSDVIENIHGFYVRSLILIAMTATLLVFFGLLASHKLAGPIVKLERFLGSVADGDYSKRIAFRRKDNLDGFAEDINRMADSIQRRRTRAHQLLQELAGRGELFEGGGAERERIIADMERLVVQLKQAV